MRSKTSFFDRPFFRDLRAIIKEPAALQEERAQGALIKALTRVRKQHQSGEATTAQFLAASQDVVGHAWQNIRYVPFVSPTDAQVERAQARPPPRQDVYPLAQVLDWVGQWYDFTRAALCEWPNKPQGIAATEFKGPYRFLVLPSEQDAVFARVHSDEPWSYIGRTSEFLRLWDASNEVPRGL
jgi:hypothetical protein